MKKTSQYIWVSLLILAILVIDAYYQVTESPVPIWQTEWFMWRIFGFAIIIIGLGVYYMYRLSKKRNKELEIYKFKMMDAQESEWKRVAGELHDNIGQNLSAMNIFLQQNIKSLPDLSDEKRSLEAVSDMLVETLEDVRRISSKLYPQQIERLGLTIAIQSMIQKLDASTGIKFTHIIDNIDLLFPKETEIYFYRIIQEVLNNLIKHSKAKNADIEITRTIMFVQASIKDDGIGFDMSKHITSDASKLGFGLINLEDRIKLVKGTYEVQSEPEKGTLLKITVPIKLKSKHN
jgi:signal transduction histidine kinase